MWTKYNLMHINNNVLHKHIYISIIQNEIYIIKKKIKRMSAVYCWSGCLEMPVLTTFATLVPLLCCLAACTSVRLTRSEAFLTYVLLISWTSLSVTLLYFPDGSPTMTSAHSKYKWWKGSNNTITNKRNYLQQLPLNCWSKKLVILPWSFPCWLLLLRSTFPVREPCRRSTRAILARWHY